MRDPQPDECAALVVEGRRIGDQLWATLLAVELMRRNVFEAAARETQDALDEQVRVGSRWPDPDEGLVWLISWCQCAEG